LKTNINKYDLEVGHPHNVVLCLPFLVELDFGKVAIGGEGKTPVPREKPLGAREKTNNKLNPHIVSTLGFQPSHQDSQDSNTKTCLLPKLNNQMFILILHLLSS